MKIFKSFLTPNKFFFLTLFLLLINPSTSFSAEVCNFTKDLDLEVVGEEVRCLQKYLNSAGFVISSSGVGSPGRETTQFKDLTKKAVIKWQTANGLPASGFFGPLSQKKYSELVKGISTTQTPVTVSAEEIKAKIALVTAQLQKAQKDSSVAEPVSSPKSETEAKEAIEDSLEKIYKAQDQIREAKDDGKNVVDAEKDMEKSREYFFDAITAYFDNSFSKVVSLTEKSDRYADDAIEGAGGKTDEKETEEYLDEVQDQIDSAENKIEEADDNGRDVTEAEDLLEEAIDLLDQANDKFDDENFNEAEDLAEEAEDKADEAVDSIGDTNKTEARNAINDAQNAINDAQDEIDDADGDTDEAENLLNQAENKLDDARDEYSDGRYDDAVDLAEEAEDLAGDAKREV